MSQHFDARWANERLLDFALILDVAATELRELRDADVSAQRIFNLYPLEMEKWIEPLQEKLAQEAVAMEIWAQSNTFDSYHHILKRISPPVNPNLSSEMESVSLWSTSLRRRGDSLAVVNAKWSLSIFFSALTLLASDERWIEFYRDEYLIRHLPDFEDAMQRVLGKISAA